MPLSALTAAKVALATIGLLVWGYGYRADSAEIRWVGIAFLAAAVVMRLVGRRGGRDEEEG
jgi:hypothetical protein